MRYIKWKNTVKKNKMTWFTFDFRLVILQKWHLIAFLGTWEFSEQIAEEIHWDLLVQQQMTFHQIL